MNVEIYFMKISRIFLNKKTKSELFLLRQENFIMNLKFLARPATNIGFIHILFLSVLYYLH